MSSDDAKLTTRSRALAPTLDAVGTLQNNWVDRANLLAWLAGGVPDRFSGMSREQGRSQYRETLSLRATVGVAAVVVFAAALSGCSGLPGSGAASADKPKVAFESRPPGAQTSLSPGGTGCTTPCSVPAPDKSGSYNATFTLPGYVSQTLPVRITVTRENWYSSEIVEVSPNPILAVLEPEKKPVASSRRK